MGRVIYDRVTTSGSLARKLDPMIHSLSVWLPLPSAPCLAAVDLHGVALKIVSSDTSDCNIALDRQTRLQ